jgi:hypothetical protein
VVAQVGTSCRPAGAALVAEAPAPSALAPAASCPCVTAAAAAAACSAQCAAPSSGRTVNSGESHRFLASGRSNRPARSSNTAAQYTSPPRAAFHWRHAATGASTCIRQ